MAGTLFLPTRWFGFDEAIVYNPAATLTDFTLIIDVRNLSYFFKKYVQFNGSDIRITKGDGTELPYDLINWKYHGGNISGLIRVKWIGDLLTDSIQKVRVWAGYTGGTAVAYDANDVSGYGSDDAYASHWKAYWPLDSTTERTSTGADLTASGGVTVGGATGLLGDCTDFDSTDDYLYDASDLAALDLTGDMSVLAMINMDTTADNDAQLEYAIASKDSSSQRSWHFSIHDKTGYDNKPRLFFNGGSNSPSNTNNIEFATTLSVSTWYGIAATKSGTSGVGYVNGVDDTSNTPSLPATHNAGVVGVRVGARNYASFENYFDGRIQHCQIHNTNLASEWISHEYDQTSDNATFWGTWSWNNAHNITLTDNSNAKSITIHEPVDVINFNFNGKNLLVSENIDVFADKTFYFYNAESQSYDQQDGGFECDGIVSLNGDELQDLILNNINLNCSGSVVCTYCDVINSTNLAAIYVDATDETNTDSGGNTYFDFGDIVVVVPGLRNALGIFRSPLFLSLLYNR